MQRGCRARTNVFVIGGAIAATSLAQVITIAQQLRAEHTPLRRWLGEFQRALDASDTQDTLDFNELLKEISEVTSRIAKLCEALENDEELNFHHFGTTTKGKPMRMRIEADG